MIKHILNNFLHRTRNYFLNKNNTEIESKKFINNNIDKISSQRSTYIKDGYKVYSQNDEDGIIESIFSDIGIKNKLFIEIGIGNGIENNTHYLLLKNWTGLWIDINAKSIKGLYNLINNSNRLDFISKKITPDNINKILNEFKTSKLKNNKKISNNIDFFSIDIDSSDIFCINALLEFRPRLICIEYNAKFPPSVKISIDQNFNRSWDNDDYFGSSLSYIVDEMEKKEYKLISTNISGSNAFFTTKELHPLCKTYNQSINDLYMPANYNLYDYYVTDKPTNKFLKDILKTNL